MKMTFTADMTTPIGFSNHISHFMTVGTIGDSRGGKSTLFLAIFYPSTQWNSLYQSQLPTTNLLLSPTLLPLTSYSGGRALRNL